MTTSKRTTEFRYVHGRPNELTGGRPLAIGDVVKLTEAEEVDPHNHRLILAGMLIPTKERDAK